MNKLLLILLCVCGMVGALSAGKKFDSDYIYKCSHNPGGGYPILNYLCTNSKNDCHKPRSAYENCKELKSNIKKEGL